MKPRRVDVGGEGYECARRYMIRLEKRDFQEAQRLDSLAATAGMTPHVFKERLGYLVQYDT